MYREKGGLIPETPRTRPEEGSYCNTLTASIGHLMNQDQIRLKNECKARRPMYPRDRRGEKNCDEKNKKMDNGDLLVNARSTRDFHTYILAAEAAGCH